MNFLKIFFVFIFIMSLIACQPQKEKLALTPRDTLVILVRHAEKTTDAPDSSLSEEGSKRALALQAVLEYTQIDAIYSSQFKRNLDTVKPLADHKGVAITTVPLDVNNPQPYSEVLVKEIKEKHQGETILIIGHTNTIPLILNLLLEKKLEINKIEYSDFFLVKIPNTGESSLIISQYGK